MDLQQLLQGVPGNSTTYPGWQAVMNAARANMKPGGAVTGGSPVTQGYAQGSIAAMVDPSQAGIGSFLGGVAGPTNGGQSRPTYTPLPNTSIDMTKGRADIVPPKPGLPDTKPPAPVGAERGVNDPGRGTPIADPVYSGRPGAHPGSIPSPAGTNTYVRPDSNSMYAPAGKAQSFVGASTSGPGVGGVSPTSVEVAAPDYDQFSEFSDAAYDAARRYLDPEVERRGNEFEQMLINKGIDPNSEAGREALTRYNTGINDLTSKATFDALGEGRGYQDQLWQQGFGEAGLANALLRSQIGAEATTSAANAAASASRYGADTRLEGLLSQLDEGGRQFDLGLGQRESEFGRNYSLDRDRFGEGQYQYDRNQDLAELLASVGIDLNYADLGLRTDAANFDRDQAELDALWRFLGGLPGQSVGQYGANQGQATAGVNQGAQGGAGLGALLADLFGGG